MTDSTNTPRQFSTSSTHDEPALVVDAAQMAERQAAAGDRAKHGTPADTGEHADLAGSEHDGDDTIILVGGQPSRCETGQSQTFEFGTRTLPDLTAAHVIEEVDPHTLSNYVELTGYVRMQRVRGREVIVRGHRDHDRNVAWYDVLLHIDESDRATAFGITLHIRAHDQALMDMLESLRDGDRIWACGQLVSSETYDTRFAEPTGPNGPTLGRPMQELNMRVMRLRRARDEDANGSLVKLRGTLLQTPRITTHETETALVLARCMLNVESVLPSMNPRTRAHVHVQSRIPVDLPLLIPGAVQVLRRGNVIDVDGWLEPYRQRIRFDHDREAAAVVARMQQNFEARKQTMSAAELRRAERGFRRQLLDVQTEPRLRIRAGYVMLVEGTPIGDLDEARANYVSWDRERRRINRERAARRETAQRHLRGTAQAPPADAANSVAQPELSDGASEGTEQYPGQSAGTTVAQDRARTVPHPQPLRRHRRHLKPDETITDPTQVPVEAEQGSAEVPDLH